MRRAERPRAQKRLPREEKSGGGVDARRHQGVVEGRVRGLAVRIDTLLELPSVIERARAASPVIAQSEEGLRVARSQVRVATGAYLPTISANSAALRSNVLSPTGGGARSPAAQRGDVHPLDHLIGLRIARLSS